MEQLTVCKKSARLIRQGAMLIQQDDVMEELVLPQGTQVRLVDERQSFLAMAYIGLQHKGVAWVYSWRDGEVLELSYFETLFKQAIQKRAGFLVDTTTTAFRLFNGEGEGLGGLTIDYYAGYLVCSYYSAGIESYRDFIRQALQTSLPQALGMYEKIRFTTDQATSLSRHVWGQVASTPHLIKENGVTFATYLDDGLMTGIFLDQREVRARLCERYSLNKRILNTFSYTGAFSVVATVGGACQTVSVDVANRSREKTLEQFEVNNLLDAEPSIYVMDVFDYVDYARKKQLQFDTIVVDPPSFARTKKRTFSVAKDYGTFIEKLIPLAAPHATLLLSTNAANLSKEAFKRIVERALQVSGRNYSLVELFDLPEDFPVAEYVPSSDYLKVWVVRLDG